MLLMFLLKLITLDQRLWGNPFSSSSEEVRDRRGEIDSEEGLLVLWFYIKDEIKIKRGGRKTCERKMEKARRADGGWERGGEKSVIVEIWVVIFYLPNQGFNESQTANSEEEYCVPSVWACAASCVNHALTKNLICRIFLHNPGTLQLFGSRPKQLNHQVQPEY